MSTAKVNNIEPASGVTVTITGAALTTPALGTPASGNLANCTGLPASAVVNTPAGGISATTVQAALNELDTAIAGKLGLPEQGTWTPSDVSGAGLTFTQNNTGLYAKTGNQVTCSMDITFPVTADTNIARVSLPFATMLGASFNGAMGYQDLGVSVFPSAASGGASFVFWNVGGTVLTNAALSGKRFSVSFSYRSA